MAKERQIGIQEQILECLQNMETHMGVLAKNGALGSTVSTGVATKTQPVATDTKPATKTETKTEVTNPTADEVRKILKEYAETFGRESAITLLAEKKYKNAGAVPADQRAEFINYVNESRNATF